MFDRDAFIRANDDKLGRCLRILIYSVTGAFSCEMTLIHNVKLSKNFVVSSLERRIHAPVTFANDAIILALVLRNMSTNNACVLEVSREVGTSGNSTIFDRIQMSFD